jgi:hypothetical protein
MSTIISKVITIDGSFTTPTCLIKVKHESEKSNSKNKKVNKEKEGKSNSHLVKLEVKKAQRRQNLAPLSFNLSYIKLFIC